MQDISKQLERKEEETWAQCIHRLAAKYHLEEDVRESYSKFLEEGMTEAHAAFHACYEWDVLPSKQQSSLREVVKDIVKKNI